MAVYHINLALILGLGVPLCVIKPSKLKKALYVGIVFAFMWFISAFRYGIGFDYENYITIFNDTRSETLYNYYISSFAPPSGFFAAAAAFIVHLTTLFEPGFIILNKLIAVFTIDPVAMYSIYAFLLLAPAAWFIYRHCDDAWLSSWLYVTLAFLYSNMNFIRQGMACGVIMLGYRFLRDRRALPFIAVVLLAAGFHRTALIMIPVYFLCGLKLTLKLGAVYAGLAVTAYLLSSFIVELITKYVFEGYRGTIWLEYGMPIHFVYFPAVIFGTCLALKRPWERIEPNANLLLNLALFSLLIWVFITRHFILERFSMYMYVFVILALPSALSALKPSAEVLEKRDKAAEAVKSAKKPGKEQMAALAGLNRRISDHKKYYWCAAAAIMLFTLVFHEYGGNVNNFHGVFPYNSVFEWLGSVEGQVNGA